MVQTLGRRYLRRSVALFVLFVVPLSSATVPASGVVAAPVAHVMRVGDKDCADFASQRAAQIFFLKHGGPQNDPHRLDSEGDGIACEANPCPCYKKRRLPDTDGSTPPKRVRQKAKVVRVSDGDTIVVKFVPGGKREVRVRLVGIDSPEVFGTTECGGPAASKTLKRLLPKGTIVRLVSDPTQQLKDRFGRLLRYVMKKDLDVNRRQVYLGHARLFLLRTDPFERARSYRAAATEAREAKRGLWGNCA